MTRLSRLYYLSILIVFASCGVTVKKANIKEFRVTMTKGDESFRPLIKALVLDFNANAGMTALEYVESPDQANSFILVTEGLESRDGKVGWGQWFTQTERNGSYIPGTTIHQTTDYTLQVEFDAGFIQRHGKILHGTPDIGARKLFAHEIGHGFQMEHESDETSVMYEDITGNKDFSKYWPRVRAFFAD